MSQPVRAQFIEGDGYRLLVDAISDYAIYMLDPDGRVASWNTGAERFKGYKAKEIIGQHFSRFYTEEDRRAGLPQIALRTADREGRFEQEGWRVRKDGARFWAHVVMDTIRDPCGELVGFAKITRDLTERNSAQDALRHSEQQFKRLVEGVTDYAIYMLDPEGRIVSWNAGAQRFKGYAADEILGEHFSRFYTDEDRAHGRPQEALRIAEAEGRFEKEGWRVRKDGTQFWAHVVIDAIHDHGRLIGFAKITRDVTERLEAQLALERTQQALFQSQKLESIGQLTGGVAHDFNNLLTAIMGSLELLQKRLPEDRKAQLLLNNAIQGAQRGASLTQRMLAFARRQELNAEAIDIPRLVRGMTGLMERSIGPSIRIRTQFAQATPLVRSDENQLEAALLNLVLNARDAMPAGGLITIGATQERLGPGNDLGAVSGRYVRLWVTDTGEGMDDETRKRAMEPFFTTKGVGKGTGLGLSMVHGLAEQSGGKLGLTSTPGAGTTVEIWLPVEDAPVTAALPARLAPAASGNQHRLTVLVVDDDQLVLVNTVAMVEDLGHEVIEADSGAKGVEILTQRPELDLIITDQVMPGMTGLELASVSRAYRPALPIILTSGYAELPAQPLPSIVRLPKPFNQAELAEAIYAAEVVLPPPLEPASP